MEPQVSLPFFSPPVDSAQNQMNPVHILTHFFL